MILHSRPDWFPMLSRVLAVSAAFLGGAALLLGPALPAAAATAPTSYANVGTGGDVNYLPSTQLGKYDGLTDNQRLNQMAQDAYASMKTQSQTDSVVRFTGGTGIVTTTSPGQVTQYIETVDGVLEDDAREIRGQTTSIRTGGALRALGTAGEAIGAYSLGTAAVNGAAALLGIDTNGTVCRSTADGSLGSKLIRLADGAVCAADPFAPEYVKNADVVAGHKAGWLTYPIPWSCPNSVAGDGCYGIYTLTPQPKAVSGLQTLTLENQITSNPQDGIYATGLCRAPSDPNSTITTTVGGPFQFGRGTNSYELDMNCPAPQVLYAWTLSTSPWGARDDPDKYLSENVRTWFSPLSPNVRPEGPSANPTRTMRCVTVGTDGKTYAGAPSTYTEEELSMPTPACADLPDGVMPSKVTVERTTDGKTETDVLGTWDTDQDVLDWAKQYPACTVHSLCNTSLQTKTATGWKTCTDGDPTCADWFTSPQKNDTYRCMYGIPGSQSLVNLSECDLYQNRFTPDAQKTGNTLTDPKTGKPLQNPKPANNPATDPAVSNRPISDGETRAQCFPTGWGAVNPVNWVMQPVTCAFQNLLVPKASTIPNARIAVRSAVNNSTIGTLQTNVGALGVVGFGNGCSGLPVEWSIFGGHFKLNLLAACPGDPLHAVAAATHTILAGLIVTLSLLAILRYIAVIFGFSGLGRQMEVARLEAQYKRGAE